MKKIIQYLMMLMVSLMATSCYYDEMPLEAVTPIPDTVSYSRDIQPLWDESCVSCHKQGATPPDLTPSNSYIELTKNNKYVIPGDAAKSALTKSLTGGMPPTSVFSASEMAIIEKWINNGALNN